ncbi:DNA replication and repair protein RecF [Pelagicoccus sp. SDUM812005]|uniref:DNA replication/repair protein RecF n=1 Tax=Pelagicoccus sp. SDUM812005 TaxID=3041257 RepID=UPI00280F409D|nr:DNA replication and repair protein RecF [Pelagicoccus sp. SDUM812005]MDQ8182880.1 DNA replication and repair protein RecF [Pelagicoccus sp. SDUM812005]
MRFKTVAVSNYRNIKFARLDVDADRVFFLGRNGQGKTNLLEATGYVTSLRAFRARENETLLGPESPQAEILFEMEHEEYDEVEARVRIKKKGKEVYLDREPVRRASDFVGRFPAVMLSSEDLSIVRGSPGGRRRFIDTFLCGIDRDYYVALQRYQKCIQERNALLKKGAAANLMKPFEVQMVQPCLEVIRKREKVIGELGGMASRFYEMLSGSAEEIGMSYKPNASPEDEDAYWALLERNRRRDEIMHSTSKGPHRDDFELSLNGRPAADFASDGQQRSIALSLAFATIAYWRERFGVCPVLLIDDVLGELDPMRRQRFWNALDGGIQLIATGTELPDAASGKEWRVYEVEKGEFKPSAP